ncbi:MAG: hypothetical protein N2442_14825, partial [Spirochaetes bacterium]|nr:hypothetical protein [Spirochaetota bacterium]
ALNSCAKFRARVLPTIQEYQEKFDQPPKGLSFSFAALLFYYRGTIHPSEAQNIKDNPEVLEFFRSLWSKVPLGVISQTEGFDREVSSLDIPRVVRMALSESSLWGTDLSSPSLVKEVSQYLESILQKGMYPALQQILQ